uniref:Uncharacterized protein n=1 Tax=Human betaherpesvirus 6 TaxID=10368 RepID=A0A5P9ULJ2_9BETA|nr:hypothetical protein [Human betaherpesvirus 6]
MSAEKSTARRGVSTRVRSPPSLAPRRGPSSGTAAARPRWRRPTPGGARGVGRRHRGRSLSSGVSSSALCGSASRLSFSRQRHRFFALTLAFKLRAVRPYTVVRSFGGAGGGLAHPRHACLPRAGDSGRTQWGVFSTRLSQRRACW